MTCNELYPSHIAKLRERYEESIGLLNSQDVGIEAVLVHSGSLVKYFADDLDVPFRPHAHFRHWLPVHRPEQMILLVPGERPTYFRVQPQTFWSDGRIPLEPWWANEFEIVDLGRPEDILDHLPSVRRIAFLGRNTSFAAKIGLPSILFNEKHLRNRLDHHRSLKTEYEVELIRASNRIAGLGHAAARTAFFEGKSEQEVHRSYLNACGALDADMPYPTIVAFDERASILHYQHKRIEDGKNSRLMLIDAGFTQRGYASDITRTYVRANAPPVVHELLRRVTGLKDLIISEIFPGVQFNDLNQQAHGEVTRILSDLEIVRGEEEELLEIKISDLFFPHGLGHLLGIQVHDVSGLFIDETGALEPPPHEHKSLRLTRRLEEGMVYTIEPGIYFIPHLLDLEENAAKRMFLNKEAVDELIPWGGVRIEDNLVLRGDRAENLTTEAMI